MTGTPGKRRTPLGRQIAATTCGVVALAVLLAGLVAVGLIRTSYDGKARDVLHREALLVATLSGRTATSAATRLRRPAGRVLTNAGLTVVRVQADGAAPRGLPLSSADIASAAGGESLQGSRTLRGHRYFIDIEPVTTPAGAPDGGVLVAEPVNDARSVDRAVLRRIAGALLIGLVGAAIAGTLLARRLARPLVGAAQVAHRLAAGERAVRVSPEGPAEIADVAESLNSLAEALTTSEARQQQFLVSISHELRTPLTAIRGFAESLADGVSTGPDAVRAGRTIEAEANRMQRLVADLLDLARLGADEFRLSVSRIDVVAAMSEAAGVWAARCKALGVPFRLEGPGPDPVLIDTDPVRLRQILDNLAENALRVTPAGRPIVFALALRPGAAALSVRDGGPGLTEADLADAFDRSVLYERYRGVRPVGTGVGLALVAALATRLGGRVHAAAAPEGGAAFTVTLPQPAADPRVGAATTIRTTTSG